MNNLSRFEVHSHTEYSNIRLLDCINKVDRLINRAVELGLKGIAITDHECLSSHIKANKIAKEIMKDNPDFKVALGNEIYLTGSREMGQKYFHFILIAKNFEGHKVLRKLSSIAWMNSYYDRGMERVPTLYDELAEALKEHPGCLIGTTACLGGELSTAALDMINAETIGDTATAQEKHNEIVNFVLWCKENFGEDFYIECAPGCSADQIKVNKRLMSIAKAFNVKMVIGTDAHYLKKEDRFVHKAYLNSKGGEREVDEFYEYSYLQTNEEIIEHLEQSEFSKNLVLEMFKNSEEIYEKIENYSLEHKQTIPKVEVKNYHISASKQGDYFENNYPILSSMLRSSDIVERYWVNECIKKLNELNKNNETYLSRLEEEADIKMTIGEKLETNMFAYPVTLQHYVDLFWDCGSIVGAGRGSSCSGLNHYLLGITQLDPIEWDLPFWRYLNKERTELGDIDLDLCPSKRPLILRKIKEERGQNFNSSIDDLSRKNLGCTLIATFGTEGTRSTILTACRGYRSNEYPDGIDVDIAQYLTSLVPSERGFLWTLNDIINGNEEKGRKPNKIFINEINQFPGLLDIMMGIEGLINKRSSHASGVILFDEDPYEFGCFMRTPKGEIITQYDLHDCEAAGMTKYDFLVTEVQDKLAECIKLLQENNEIEKDLTLRQVYDKYFHPNVLPLNDEKYWDSLQKGNVLNIFQFDSEVGSQAAKKIKPTNILEMADANGLMRLMTAEKGEETPMEKYVRYKNDISLWYDEMERHGLSKEEQSALEPYFKTSYGVPPSQEQLMRMLMDKKICGFSLADANNARKIVGKKQMSKIPELKAKVLKQATNKNFGEYVWKYGIGPQMGYSFSIIHALAYSFIGFQTLYIANNWNPIYWNTACLIVNSGSLEVDDSTVETREKSTDYAKVAKALSDIISRGIKVSLIDINNSDYSFKPDIKSNEILFGMKALSGISTPVIDAIKAGRPYSSIKDFMMRCPLNKTAMISLIKGGAFDKVDESWAKELNIKTRIASMAYYLSIVSEPKSKLNLTNFNSLMQRGLLPDELDFEKKVFAFNKYLKANCKVGKYFVLNDYCYKFYSENFDIENLEVINGLTCILQTKWDKMYQKSMDGARDWLKDNQEKMLKIYNTALFEEMWNKYAAGNTSAWEMDSLCFYYGEHELAKVDTFRYGIVDFNSLPDEPEVDYYFKRNGKNIPIYKTFIIIGTVLNKNDNRSSIDILTPSGEVVNVKFTRDYYAMFGKQISEKGEDGVKHVVEKGWFIRGTKIMVTGFRQGDIFITKTYKHTPTHQLYKILDVKDNGEIEITNERYEVKEYYE